MLRAVPRLWLWAQFQPARATRRSVIRSEPGLCLGQSWGGTDVSGAFCSKIHFIGQDVNGLLPVLCVRCTLDGVSVLVWERSCGWESIVYVYSLVCVLVGLSPFIIPCYGNYSWKGGVREIRSRQFVPRSIRCFISGCREPFFGNKNHLKILLRSHFIYSERGRISLPQPVISTSENWNSFYICMASYGGGDWAAVPCTPPPAAPRTSRRCAPWALLLSALPWDEIRQQEKMNCLCSAAQIYLEISPSLH